MVPMTRLGNKLFSSVLSIAVATSLAACGGGGSHVSAVPQAQPTTSSSAAYTGPLSDATFKITIPVPATSAKARRPAYVSSSTTKIVFTLNSATIAGMTGATLATFNTTNLGAKAVTLNSATCPGSGPWTCTLTIKLPPGTDNVTISAQDGSSNILSQQVQNFVVVVATANSFSTTLDANAATITVTGSQACQIGTVGTAYGSVGTTPVTFTVSYTDLAGKTIVAPGLPKLEIQDGSAVYQSASGTIGSGGTGVSFTINQAAQTFTITPNSTSSSVTINVKAIQADSNVPVDTNPDGLSFARTKSYTFQTGVAPPTHNFLGAIEQLTLSSGQVDFFNVTLGGNSPGSDTFAAFSPATLAVTASTNQAGVNDVDNPSDLRWDTNGDLLIANGGGAPGDNGNMACVPVGAIATGANASTTVTANVDAPVSIAYDTRDGSVALANNPTSASVQLSEYALTGNYTASSNNLTASGFGSLGSVTEMPSLTKGTYAISLATGAEEDPAHAGTTGTNKVVIFSPTGVSTTLSDDVTFTIDEPWGLAWDAAHSQLVIANHSTFHRLLSFYSDTGTLIKNVNVTHRMSVVAASADGHVAVAYTTSFGYMQVQVYANAAGATAPTAVFGPIPYNGTTTSCGSTYIYGNGTTIVNALKWLSNTKLLVAVQSNNSGTPTSLNGFYIYDITASAAQAGFDDVSCAAFAAAPVNTGFVHVNNKPLGAAFKP
jgi:hypothetical protein